MIKWELYVMSVVRLPIKSKGSWPSEARIVGVSCKVDEPCGTLRKTISIERRVEFFADDINTRHGIVSRRVTLLSRSIEIQPLSLRFVPPNPCVACLPYKMALWLHRNCYLENFKIFKVCVTPSRNVLGPRRPI